MAGLTTIIVLLSCFLDPALKKAVPTFEFHADAYCNPSSLKFVKRIYKNLKHILSENCIVDGPAPAIDTLWVPKKWIELHKGHYGQQMIADT